MRRLRAVLVWQPKPIPVLNKALPSKATTLAVLGLWAITIFYSLYKVPLTLSMVFVLADRFSLIFVINLPLLYLFAAKNQPLRVLTGYSYESLNIVHRRLGEIMCLLALLHSAGMIVVWYTLLRPSGLTLLTFLLKHIIWLGFGALVAYEGLYLTSLGSFRERWYETFLGLHIVLQVLALVFLWFHHSSSRVYVIIALGIFLVDRLIYRSTLNCKTVVARLEIKDDQETVGLHASWPLTTTNPVRNVLNSGLEQGWRPTEHVFVSIPALARKHIVQAHPFTISSCAPSSAGTDLDGKAATAHLSLLVRSQSGFSSDLLHYAQGHSAVSIRLDGPYGSQSAVSILQDCDLSIIVAGGSGIAVAWPLVHAVLKSHVQRTDPENRPASEEAKRVLFVWIVHKSSHVSWISDIEMEEVKRSEAVDIVIPPATELEGRPDIREIIKTWCERIVQSHGRRRDQSGKRSDPKIGMVVSGPDGLNRTVRNLASEFLWDGWDVAFEVEKFGW